MLNWELSDSETVEKERGTQEGTRQRDLTNFSPGDRTRGGSTVNRVNNNSEEITREKGRDSPIPTGKE